MRQLALFFIGIVFGIAGGFLLAGGMEASGGGHSHSDAEAHDHSTHDHDALTEWDGPVPDIALHLWPDAEGAVNIRLDAEGFIFTPEEVNGSNTPASGHAHVYVNDEKVARMYGPYMQVTGIERGDVIRVTLNANDHTEWAVDGVPVAASVTVP